MLVCAVSLTASRAGGGAYMLSGGQGEGAVADEVMQPVLQASRLRRSCTAATLRQLSHD